MQKKQGKRIEKIEVKESVYEYVYDHFGPTIQDFETTTTIIKPGDEIYKIAVIN